VLIQIVKLCLIAEQYDAFVKFNYDQVQRRFETSAPTCKYIEQQACKNDDFRWILWELRNQRESAGLQYIIRKGMLPNTLFTFFYHLYQTVPCRAVFQTSP